MSEDHFTVASIGRVQVDEDGFALVIAEPYRPALAELDGFSHLNVLWWCHLLDDPMFREMTIAEQPYRDAPAAIGIFATRSPARPNPIAADGSAGDLDRRVERHRPCGVHRCRGRHADPRYQAVSPGRRSDSRRAHARLVCVVARVV